MTARAKGLLKGGIGGAMVAEAGPIVPEQSALEDDRAAEITQAGRDAVEWRERARAALEEADARLSDRQLDEVVSSLRSLDAAAQDAKTWMLETGQGLLRLQRLVGPGGYKALVRAGLVSIPEDVASRLRKIAAAVAEGRIDPRLLPSQIKPAYAVVSLPAEHFTLVAERVRLGPDTTTREIQEVASQVRAEVARQAVKMPERGERLQQRRDQLEREIGKLERQRDAEIEKVRQRFALRIQAAQAELEALAPKRRGRSQHAA